MKLLLLFLLASSFSSESHSFYKKYQSPSSYQEGIFATLKDELDASYYTIQSNRVYFKYEEKYDAGINGSTLDYKVYDFRRVALNTQSIVLTKKIGTNFLVLDLTGFLSLDGQSVENFYLLEVTNSKGQKQYLRLRYIP